MPDEQQGACERTEIDDAYSSIGQGIDFNGVVYGGKLCTQAAGECVIDR